MVKNNPGTRQTSPSIDELNKHPLELQ